MPTAKPRVNVAMDQADFDLLSAFAASQGVSRASVLVELWQMAAPVMARVLKLVEEAQRAKDSVRKGIVEATVEAEAKMLPMVLSSQPGTTIGRFFSAAASIQLFLGSIS